MSEDTERLEKRIEALEEKIKLKSKLQKMKNIEYEEKMKNLEESASLKTFLVSYATLIISASTIAFAIYGIIALFKVKGWY